VKSAALVLLALCTASAVRAQVVPGSAPTAEQAAAVADVTERTLSDPTLRSAGRSTTPAISFQFSSEDKTATAQVGGGMGSARRWGLTVSGPLGKGPRTTLATGEGLSHGFSAELLLRNLAFGSAMELPAERFQDLCDAYVRPAVRRRKAAERTLAVDAARSAAAQLPAGPEKVSAEAQAAALAVRPLGCEQADFTPEGRRRLAAETFGAVWAYGISAKVGRTTFDFANPVTFVDSSRTHDGWSASANVGRFQSGSLAALLYYVGASFRHEVAYRAESDARNVCTPIAASSSAFCRETAVGGPHRQNSDLVQVEGRSFLGSSVGLAPRATFELNQSEWFVEVPVYLRDVEGPFNGGVSIGWDSKQNDIVLSLFVGALPRLQ